MACSLCGSTVVTTSTNPIIPAYNPCCSTTTSNNGGGTDTFQNIVPAFSSACKAMYGFDVNETVTYNQFMDSLIQRVLCQCGCSDKLSVDYGRIESGAIAADPASVTVYLNGTSVNCYDLKGQTNYQAAVVGLSNYGISLFREEDENNAGEYFYRHQQTVNCLCDAYTLVFTEGEAIC